MAYEDWGDLGQVKAAPLPPESPSLIGRLLERGANAPADVLNDFFNVAHNVGVSDEQRQVPTPYDIPEAKSLPEGLVDLGAGVAEAVPLFASGEGAGEGLAKLFQLGPLATRVATRAAGFGLSDLSRSPEQGAIGTGVGGLMGAAEAVGGVLPRVAATLGLGAATYLGAKHQEATDKQAATQAGVNMILSQIFRMRRPAPESPASPLAPPSVPLLPYNEILQGRVIPRPPRTPYGGELPGRPLALEGGNRLPTLEGEFTMEPQPQLPGPVAPLQLEAPRQPLPEPPPAPTSRSILPPSGSLVREPAITMNEMLRSRGIQPPEPPVPPEGSLIRQPAITMDEVQRALGTQEQPGPLPPRSPIAPIAPRAPEPPAAPRPPAAPAAPTTGEAVPSKPQRLLLKSTLSTGNEELSQMAAGKLGVNYDGVYGKDIEGFTPQLQFTFPGDAPHAAHGATFTVPEGSTYAQLKDKVKQKIKDFEAAEPAAILKGEGVGQAPKIEAPKSFAATSEPSGESKVATLQPADFSDIAYQQRGKPESAMIKVSHTMGGGVINPVVEDAGDLIHRMTEKNSIDSRGYQYVKEKVERLLRYLKSGYGFVREFEENITNNAKFSKRPEDKFRNKIYRELQKYADEHRQLQPRNEVQKLANDAAIAIGERRFGDAQASLEQLKGVLDKGEGAWKAEADKVATLQPKSAEAASPSFSSETPPPAGMEYGQIVKFTDGIGEDKVTVTGVLHPPVEEGLYRIKSGGDEYDVRPEKIQGATGTNVDENAEKFVQAGGAKGVEKARQDAGKGMKFVGGGKMKLSNFGEHGFTIPEGLEGIAKYVLGPFIGGSIGYATADREDKYRAAIIGALIGGFGSHFGFKMLKLLAEGHDISKPTPVGATSGGVSGKKVFGWAKNEAVEGLKAVFGNAEMAERAARMGGMSTAWDRFARWMEHNFSSDWWLVREFQKADGLVNEVLGNAADNLRNMLKHPDFIGDANKAVRAAFRKYLSDGDFAAFKAAVPQPELQAMAASVKDSIKSLAEAVASGLPVGSKLRIKIESTLDSYLVRAYRAFEDKANYRPDESKVVKAAMSIMNQFPDMDLGQVVGVVRSYLEDIRSGKPFGATLDGVSIGGALTGLKKLTPEFREMLEPISDPIQRAQLTLLKLGHVARAGTFFNEVARMIKGNGLKYAYSAEEHRAEVATLQQLAMRGDEAAKAKLKEVLSYVYQPMDERAGRLAGQFVDRRVRDQIVSFEKGAMAFSSPLINGIAKATNLIKYNKIILNPLQFARQFVQLPILGAMARTGPQDWIKSFQILKEGGAEFSRLRKLGVMSGDIIEGMIRKDARFMLNGTLDAMIGSRLSRGLHNWEELWRMPDLVIRTSAFLKKEEELLAKGMSAEDAANGAIDHMNRYTMNYAAVSPFVRKSRQLPFLNQYLSWTAETLRITKNLVEDVRTGNENAVYAGGVLTMLASVPASMAYMSEQSLSEKDRDEWNKVKDIGAAYSRYNFRIVMGRLPNGDFRYLDFTPLVVHDQLMRMTKAIAAGDQEGFMAANPLMGWENTPALNIFSILTTQRDRFTGDKLYSNAAVASAVWREAGPSIIGGTESDRWIRALTPDENGNLGIIDKRTGRQSSIGDLLFNYASSIRPYTLRPSMYRASALNDAQEQIRQQQRVMRKVMQTNESKDGKEQARQDFIDERNRILSQLRQKLGLPAPQSSL